MSKRYIPLLLLTFLLAGPHAVAQTLAEAQKMYKQGDYANAKPVFERYLKRAPNNGNYNLWYGVCCLKTGEAQAAIKPLQTAVKRRVASGQLYLGQAYNAVYRYEEAVATLENYIADLTKRKRPLGEAEVLLAQSKAGLRMLKGVEQVTVIDSFVTSKEHFLQAYKISPESGKIHTYGRYFPQGGKSGGIVYETELGDKLYYSELQADSTLHLYSSIKLIDEWGAGTPLLPQSNDSANADYPYVLGDGITVYYAADGAQSLGGYDIFVTRYNPESGTCLNAENIGMPFNSPANDYMYVIDEFNNLGWFASDRHQPTDSVCIYVFIPNASKQVYNYESMEPEKLRSLARLHSIKDTWNDAGMVASARERLVQVQNALQEGKKPVHHDFEFIVDDKHTYYQQKDFRSSQAWHLYLQYQEKDKSYQLQRGKLEALRLQYSHTAPASQSELAPAIIDLEKRLKQMSMELHQTAIRIRQLEKNNAN